MPDGGNWKASVTGIATGKHSCGSLRPEEWTPLSGGEVHELTPSSLLHRRGRGVALRPGGAKAACVAVTSVANDPPPGGGLRRDVAGAHAARGAPDPGRAGVPGGAPARAVASGASPANGAGAGRR